MMNKLFFVLIFLLTCCVFPAQDRYNTLVYEGNRAFDKENYESASGKYMEAAKAKVKDFAAHYNLGNALYKQKKYEEAKAEYLKAESLAKNQNDKNAVAYNLGNANMKAGDNKKAAEYYKKALKKDPYNDKIRKNYEIAMLKDKQNQQNKQDNKNDKGGKGGDGKDQNQQGDQNKDGKNPSDGSGNQNQKGNGEGDQPNQNKKQNEGSKMPKDLEDAILNRVKGKEQETARRILNKNTYSVPQSKEKDW